MSSALEKIDKNFAIPKTIDKEDVVFYNVLSEPFKIHGLILPKNENEIFCRIDSDVAQTVSEGVFSLNTHTAGGRVRFVTDSPYIAIRAALSNMNKLSHLPLTASAGLDMYFREGDKEIYKGTFRPPFDIEVGFESVINCEEGEKTVTINFPLFSNVEALFVGIKEGATLKSAPDYTHSIPIVYYGSSITQGGCASRPGNTYESIISRELDCDYINLGFSGNAKGEKEISEYIRKLDMSIFVYDYDHNAPTLEHLKDTHERMFKEFREANPNTPVIMLSRPKFYLTKEEEERARIVRQTYENALKEGDKNVYHIYGKDLLSGFAKNDGTVDNTHPNDMGFASIAEKLCSLIKEILL